MSLGAVCAVADVVVSRYSFFLVDRRFNTEVGDRATVSRPDRFLHGCSGLERCDGVLSCALLSYVHACACVCVFAVILPLYLYRKHLP